MNVIKTFSTYEIVNICAFVNNNVTEDQIKELPTKTRWYLKKNIDKIIPIVKTYEEFRDSLVKELQEKYFTNDRSDEYLETKKDTDGNPIIKEDGSEETVQMRKIKDEYLDEYTSAVNELNEKLQEILNEQNDVDISTINMDAFVENLPDDTSIGYDFLSILSFMDETTNVKVAEDEED